MVQLRITREVILRALAWPEIDFHVGTKYAKATFSQGWVPVLHVNTPSSLRYQGRATMRDSKCGRSIQLDGAAMDHSRGDLEGACLS